MSEDKAVPRYVSIYRQQVVWGDMDAFGHLNNVMYFRYIESARIDYLRQTRALTPGVLAVLAQTGCSYFSPVVYPDHISIGCNVTHVGTTSFTMTYELWSHTRKQLVARAEAVIVMIEAASGQKTPITDGLREAIRQLAPQLEITLAD